MLKATLRSAVLLGLLALSLPAYAEVQNIKVGGDTTVRGFWRKNMDLNRDKDTGTTTVSGRKDAFMMQTTGLSVDADLTENVAAHMRVVNERDWGQDVAGDQYDFDLSQGYIVLKELFYSPLTVSGGIMPVQWGRGFVLGSNLIPGTLGRGGDQNGSITANEFTDFTAFEGLRAVLDLGGAASVGFPLTIDAVYLKLIENEFGDNDDVNLMGVNLGTRFDQWNSEAQTYYLLKRDSQKTAVTPAGGSAIDSDNDGELSTWGLRGSAKPSDASSFWGELAYQHGTRTTDPAGSRLAGEHISAWAMNFGGQYTLADVAMTPGFGVEWIFWSGKNKSASCGDGASFSGDTDQCGAISGWDPIARGSFSTVIREFQTQDSITGFYPVDQAGVTSSATNQHQFAIFSDLDPIEDLHVNNRLTWFLADVPMLTRAEDPAKEIGSADRHRFIGTEWDTILTYNYTDDVQFGAIHALFQPGNVFRAGFDDTAQELITWARVAF